MTDVDKIDLTDDIIHLDGDATAGNLPTGGRRNPLDPSKPAKRKMPPSVKRLEANRRNARMAGRKRAVEYADVERMAGRLPKKEDNTVNQQQLADALHVSPRTVGRRIAERRQQNDPGF